MRCQVGTPLYAAPEVYNKQPYGFPADIWALGCIAHELATLAPTFESSSSRELRFKVGTARQPFGSCRTAASTAYAPAPSFLSLCSHMEWTVC